VLPVSAANAARLLAALGGPEAPEGWRGALPTTYRLGPGPARARLAVEMDLAEADLWNAIGWLPGTSDELLLVGAHHDAWDFGAVDSGSGVVATIEAARVLGPRRAAAGDRGERVHRLGWRGA
jgi:N-acetylated-alpha-linked acidic dipeptidase